MNRIKDKNLRYHLFGELLDNKALSLGINKHLEVIKHIMGEKYDYEKQGWEALPDVEQFIASYNLSDAELNALEDFTLDGGNTGPMIVWPHWGEVTVDYSEFDVASFEGIENFPNIRNIDFIGCYTEDIDMSALLKLPNLKSIDIAPENDEWFLALSKNGVDVDGFYYTQVEVDYDDVNSIMGEADNLYKHYEYKRALELYRKGVTFEKAFSYKMLKNYIAILKKKQKYTQELIELLSRAIQHNSTDDRLFYSYIKTVKKSLDDDTLNDAFSKLVEIASPKRKVKYLLKYVVYLKQKEEYETCEKQLLLALELEPKNAFVNYEYAYLLTFELERDYDRAKTMYKIALDEDPMDEDYNYNYAVLLRFEFKEYKEANKYYKKALKHSTSFDRLVQYAAYLQEEMNDPIKALKWYEKVFVIFELDNSYENIREYYSDYGELLMAQGKYKKAMKMFTLALEGDSQNRIYKYHIAQAMFNLGNLEDAHDMILELLEGKKKKNEDYNFLYLQILLAQEADIKVINKIYDFLLNKGYGNDDFITMHISKLKEEAKSPEDYVQSLKVWTNKTGHEIHMCTFAIELSAIMKQHDQAIAMLTAYNNMVPNSPNILATLGFLYLEGKEDASAAIIYYEKLLSIKFYTPHMYELYAKALTLSGDIEKRDLFLNKLLKLDYITVETVKMLKEKVNA